MFIKSLAVLFLSLNLATASPVAFSKRDAATVLADLSTLSNDLSTLDTAVEGFDGNILNALPIASDESTVENDIKQAISDTDASSAFSTSDSSSVTSAVTALEPSINKTISDLVAKKAEFTSAGVDSLVLQDLENLQNLTDTLSTSLQAKVTSSDASTIASGTTALDAAFASAIAVYSS
ncbi:hypothetical protein VTN77DRAFT_2655 [Rasamsonia byssochlamydoides]|uniref:uncharacterized protein n=1 Tax=Rasamsonia byssochlamydoides TaxID=89139 RepID=UPI003742D4AA